MEPTVVVVIVAVVIALAIGGFLLWRRRRRPEDETFYHFRCPRCKRRLRYQQRQVSHKGKCSNCGADVVFPPISQAID